MRCASRFGCPAAALTEPEAARMLREQDVIPVGNRQAEFAAFLRTETARWKDVIQRAEVKLE